MRRSWLIAAIVLGIAAIAGVALALRVTQDGGGQLSPTAWADSVCTSLATWRSSITSLADVSGEQLTPETLGSRLDDASNATSQLAGELGELSAPDLEAGDRLKQDLDAATADLEASFEALREGAENASAADSPAAFLQALAALAPRFQALLDTISRTIRELRNANVTESAKVELRQAFADAGSCQQLRAES